MDAIGLQAKDVAEKVLFEELFILDVRNEADYMDWRMEGKQVFSINKPYFDLLEGVESILEELPKGKRYSCCMCERRIFQVCCSATIEAGLKNVYYLAGGIKLGVNM